MNKLKLKQAGIRLATVLGAAVVAALVSFLSGPDVVGALGTQGALILTLVLTPLLSAAEKYLNGPTVKA
jgi:hypothetical protein